MVRVIRVVSRLDRLLVVNPGLAPCSISLDNDRRSLPWFLRLPVNMKTGYNVRQ